MLAHFCNIPVNQGSPVDAFISSQVTQILGRRGNHFGEVARFTGLAYFIQTGPNTSCQELLVLRS